MRTKRHRRLDFKDRKKTHLPRVAIFKHLYSGGSLLLSFGKPHLEVQDSVVSIR